MIRKYRASDLEALKEITAICFEGVNIDQGIEELVGLVDGKDWRWRKKRHIDEDVVANAEGIFVAEVAGEVVGYVSTRIDPATKIGGIPNISVLPTYQKQGLGQKLLETALDYMAGQGMLYARIETLAQNEAGQHLYPKVGFQEVARQIHYIRRL